jgi:putative FmdB family regulatory protein
MPTYEYRCAKCGEHLEVFQSFSEAPLTKHARCGGKLAKVLSPAGIVLKGSGFYKTDSRSAKRAASKQQPDSTGSDTASTESKSSESKTSESKTSESKAGESKAGDSKGSGSGSKKPETKSA